MAVRVRISITPTRGGPSVQGNALLNSGFETEEPQVLLPMRAAEQVGFWPKFPAGIQVKDFETPFGIGRLYHIPQAIEISILTEDRTSKSVTCGLLISNQEREILLSDIAIGELGIVLEDVGKGLWRFRDESELRTSVAPQYW